MWAGGWQRGWEGKRERERRERKEGGERRDADVHLTFLTRHILRAHCYRLIPSTTTRPPPPPTHCPATIQLHYSPRTAGRYMGKYLLTVFVCAHVY